jgi:RimJ/RimL family protein N-acetyltransferase
MIRYAFGELRLRRLVGGAMTENVRSINLHWRLGYRVERNLATWTDPRWSDTGWVTILENQTLEDLRIRRRVSAIDGQDLAGDE